MEFRTLYINIILIGIISICIIGFVVTLQLANNTPSVLSNSKLNSTYSELTNALLSSTGQANNATTVFQSETPSTGFGGLIISTIVSSGQLLTGSLRLIYDIIIGGLASLLGIPSVVIVGFSAILIGSILLLLWSLYRLGR